MFIVAYSFYAFIRCGNQYLPDRQFDAGNYQICSIQGAMYGRERDVTAPKINLIMMATMNDEYAKISALYMKKDDTV